MESDKGGISPGLTLRDYEICSVIGRGGFGVVYKAKHRELGIEVAIKEFFPSELCVRRNQIVQPSTPEFQASFEESLERFIKEAKQLEKFRDCPNIVSCRDLFSANGTAYIVMDYVHGLPLSTLLERREARGEPFIEQDLLQVITPLLSGLQTVHGSGVYHRDIKPSNVLVRYSDSAPVLIDFGAAKHEISRHTKSFAPYSDGYAALEQIGEGEIGPWTDMYGVGAVMWRMVAGGAPPFSPPNPLNSQKRAFELMHGRVDPLPSARAIGRQRFSNRILQTIDDCLVLNVNDRVQNCGKLLEKLNNENSAEEAYNRRSASEEKKSYPKERSLNQANADYVREKSGRKSKNPLLLIIGFIGLLLLLSIVMLSNQDSDNTDNPSTLESIVSDAEGGDASAQIGLGEMYFRGDGVAQNFGEAIKWFRLAADQGHADAQFYLGLSHDSGEGVPQNDQEAIKWYRLAAEQGHANAQRELTKLFDTDTVPQHQFASPVSAKLDAPSQRTPTNTDSQDPSLRPSTITDFQDPSPRPLTTIESQDPSPRSSTVTDFGNTFTRGSHSDVVLQIQGTPTSINTYRTLGHEVWSYEYSTVDIDLQTNRVLRWNNRAGNLKVFLESGVPRPSVHNFTRGSHSDEVLQIQGTPTSINTYRTLGHEVWSYEYSTVDIDLQTNRVLRWNNRAGNLKVFLEPGVPRPSVRNFTRGSHSDEVLQIQGTPTSISTYRTLGHEVWSYEYSTVDIDLQTNRVLRWNNRAGNLKVQ